MLRNPWSTARCRTYGPSFSSTASPAGFKRLLCTQMPSTKRKLYAVAAGHQPGLYESWDECERQVKGFKGAQYKSFPNKEAAEDYLETAKHGTTTHKNGSSKITSRISRAPVESVEKATSKSAAKLDSQREAGKNDIVAGSIPGEDHKPTNKHQPLRIYTDGSCRGNGRGSAIAGVGVYFGTNDPRNLSAPLDGDRQTNQRAELTAIFRALDLAPPSTDITVVTDSNYSINCITKWSDRWKRNGWKSSHGQDVENKDLIQKILSKLEQRSTKTTFEWVKGHAVDFGNIEADRLANEGANLARLLLDADAEADDF